jgi:hypothetical protein
VDEQYGRGELTVVSAAGLPSDKIGLRAQLLREADVQESTGIGVLVGALGYLRETVPSHSTADLLYAVVAEEPGVMKGGQVKDRLGREGEAFSVDIVTKTDRQELTERITAIFDPDSHQLLEESRTELTPNPSVDASPPAVIGWATFIEAELVSDTQSP